MPTDRPDFVPEDIVRMVSEREFARYTAQYQQANAIQNNIAQQMQQQSQLMQNIAGQQSQQTNGGWGQVQFSSVGNAGSLIGTTISEQEHWSASMPSIDVSRILMASLSRTFVVDLMGCPFQFRLLCIVERHVSYACESGPLRGSIFEFELIIRELEQYQAASVRMIGEMLEAEWANHRLRWRLTEGGPVEITAHERELASEQQRFEALPEEQRAGVLGP